MSGNHVTFVQGYNLYNNPEIRAMQIPAANGIGTARAMAHVFSLAIDGELGIGSNVIQRITAPQFQSVQDYANPGYPLSIGWGFQFTKNPQANTLLCRLGYRHTVVAVSLIGQAKKLTNQVIAQERADWLIAQRQSETAVWQYS